MSNNTQNIINISIDQPKLNYSRDKYLTDFGIAVLKDRYLMPNENPQELFARVARYYANDSAHAQRLYDYISSMLFMPATPILSNGGNSRGLPISCFLNEADDSIKGIIDLWSENVWLAARGGGIGSYWSNLRSIGEQVGKVGKTSGIIPFIRVMDSLTLAISQGSLRRGSAAVYLDISHPEIEEFIDIRRFIGDPNRKTPNLHHGIVISDKFMEAVENNDSWALVSPKTNEVIKEIDARSIWIRLLLARVETGEPYIIYKDHVNKNIPEHHKLSNLKVKTSNLCSEITLPTGLDHLGNNRTAVCCLSSVNLNKFNEWKDNKHFITDIMYFLDNVMQDFINKAPDTMSSAKYSAYRERSVGLGVMGFHSFLQNNMIPFGSALAKSWNIKMHKHIHEATQAASLQIAMERGPCPDALEHGIMERFSNKTAIAPTASISIICNGISPCIEPYVTNIYTHKTLSGSFLVRNPSLIKLLEEKGQNTDDIWAQIIANHGSVQQLSILNQQEKNVFKTAAEINQMNIIDYAADRTPFISQSQSINLFLPADINKTELHKVHYQAWKKGVKSLYYCRSLSLQRPENVNVTLKNNQKSDNNNINVIEEDDCLYCQ